MNNIRVETLCRKIEAISVRLEKMEQIRKKQLKQLPEGELQILRNGRVLSCYQKVEGKSISIRRKSNKAKALAIKYYLEKNYQKLKSCSERVRCCVNQLEKIETSQGQESSVLKKERTAIRHNRILQLFPEVASAMTPDEIRWVEAPYQRSSYKPEECRFETPGGVRVRSKSEYIIACFLEKKGIPYRYEPEVWTPHRIYYADFEIYVAPGATVYWEHMGMAGVEEYDAHNIEKLRDYSTVGITTRKNLIITFEEDISSEEKLLEIVEHAYVL